MKNKNHQKKKCKLETYVEKTFFILKRTLFCVLNVLSLALLKKKSRGNEKLYK